MDNRMAKMEELGGGCWGLIDSHFTLLAWRNTPVDQGIGQVGYTLAADMDHSICAYGVESGDDLSTNGAKRMYQTQRYRMSYGC